MSSDGIHDSSQLQPGETSTETGSTHRGKKLCPTCQGLDLSVDKFVIYDGIFRPSKKPSTHPFPGDDRHSSDFSLKSGGATYQVGTLNDIQARSETCSFCFLVLKSVEKPAVSMVSNSEIPNHVSSVRFNLDVPNPEAICYVNWEIDGRGNDRSVGIKARTRRLHLRWDDKALKDSYLVFVAPQRLFDFNSDSQGSWEREAFFLGRELRTDSSNQVLMKSWLDQCYQHHGVLCAGVQSPEFVEMATQSYFGVIDVLDMCLKSLPCRRVEISPKSSRSSYSSDDHENVGMYDPYVALSYVWGSKKNYTTDISNIRVHQQQGSLETFLSEIPRVIRDAMDLVRRLGFRYLWVDSLCIVQNSKRSWNLNSRVMNLIYGNASLTICAADGSDAWLGLKALDSTKHSTSQYIEECVPGVRLMVSQLAETGINSSVWNTRAWTFQERLLSRRCLIFTEGRVFFQCRSSTMSEDLVSESRGAGWSLDLAKALPQILGELKRRPIRVYINCMSRYSERKLTQPKDILAAFNGVSNLITSVMRAPFIFGLPSSHFDLALLWEPLQAVTRRTKQPGEDFQDLVFPTWSWCGWKDGPMEYRSCQIEGVLANVHEWLTEHTWIAWYIRDGHGNLRPVWDGEVSSECDSADERWKGYEAVLPDPEFKDFQTEALQHLGNPNEENFFKWVKEEQQLEKETRERETELTERTRAREGRRARESPEEDRRTGRTERTLMKPEYSDYYVDRMRPRHSHHRDSGNPIMQERNVVVRRASPSPNRSMEVDILPRGDQSPEQADGSESRKFRDEYGRNISSQTARKIRNGFQQCLPDNPFRVFIEKYTAEPDKDFPDQPLLQFWTWWASLRLVCSSNQDMNLPGLRRFDIADAVGDWCGSIMLDKNWVANEKKRGHEVDGSKGDFLAISDAKAFTKEECDIWTYYVPKEKENSEWDLYYVLLVEERDRIWYRVALGKVFKAAFENAVLRKRWREIILG